MYICASLGSSRRECGCCISSLFQIVSCLPGYCCLEFRTSYLGAQKILYIQDALMWCKKGLVYKRDAYRY